MERDFLTTLAISESHTHTGSKRRALSPMSGLFIKQSRVENRVAYLACLGCAWSGVVAWCVSNRTTIGIIYAKWLLGLRGNVVFVCFNWVRIPVLSRAYWLALWGDNCFVFNWITSVEKNIFFFQKSSGVNQLPWRISQHFINLLLRYGQ